MKKILLLEDDIGLRSSLAVEFRDRHYEVFETDSIACIPKAHLDFAVLDLRLKFENGADAIRKIKEKSPNCRIIILTGFGSIATTVVAMKLGADDYLTKPVDFELLESKLLNTNDEQVEQLERPTLSKQEYEYIQFVLAQNNGNITKAAKELGMHRQSLQRKLKKLP